MIFTISETEFFFLPAATKLGQGNIFTSVCQEFCPQVGGRVSASVHAGIPPPRSRHTPPGADPPRPDLPGSRHPPEQTPRPDTPWEQTPPPGSRLQHTVYERPVRILLECILVVSVNCPQQCAIIHTHVQINTVHSICISTYLAMLFSYSFLLHRRALSRHTDL